MLWLIPNTAFKKKKNMEQTRNKFSFSLLKRQKNTFGMTINQMIRVGKVSSHLWDCLVDVKKTSTKLLKVVMALFSVRFFPPFASLSSTILSVCGFCFFFSLCCRIRKRSLRSSFAARCSLQCNNNPTTLG